MHALLELVLGVLLKGWFLAFCLEGDLLFVFLCAGVCIQEVDGPTLDNLIDMSNASMADASTEQLSESVMEPPCLTEQPSEAKAEDYGFRTPAGVRNICKLPRLTEKMMEPYIKKVPEKYLKYLPDSWPSDFALLESGWKK